MSRLTDKTLGEATANGDGTYNGVTLVRWLYEATTGKPMDEAAALDLIEKARAKAREKKAAKNG